MNSSIEEKIESLNARIAMTQHEGKMIGGMVNLFPDLDIIQNSYYCSTLANKQVDCFYEIVVSDKYGPAGSLLYFYVNTDFGKVYSNPLKYQKESESLYDDLNKYGFSNDFIERLKKELNPKQLPETIIEEKAAEQTTVVIEEEKKA